jgi:hypothetical protein
MNRLALARLAPVAVIAAFGLVSCAFMACVGGGEIGANEAPVTPGQGSCEDCQGRPAGPSTAGPSTGGYRGYGDDAPYGYGYGYGY